MSLQSPSTVVAGIAKLSGMSDRDLRAEWSHTFGGPAPKSARREYLLRAITYHVQVGQCGGPPAPLLRSLKKLCRGEPSLGAGADTPTRTLKPGARILREWKGTVHEVEVVDAGFRYGTETYKSLSVIARQITGTRWSGPAFFGLKHAPAETNHGV